MDRGPLNYDGCGIIWRRVCVEKVLEVPWTGNNTV